MLAQVVPYGGNSVRYALEKAKAKMVKSNHLDGFLDPTEIWYRMKHHCQLHQDNRTVGRKLERYMVTFVLSPTVEESKNFTMADWAKLHDEALEVLDSVGLTPKGMEKEVKTNFTHSMNVSGLHSDSKSGILHLHIDCCRIDLDGNTNDVHDIHKRALKAAEIINQRRGWIQPEKIRNRRKEEVIKIIKDTLMKMEKFDFDRYFQTLRDRGMEVNIRHDDSGNLVGYTLRMNVSHFKASELGKKFQSSHLEETWKKLHGKRKPAQIKPSSPSITPVSKPSARSAKSVRPVPPSPTFTQPKVQESPKQSFTIFGIDTGNGILDIRIPDAVKDVFMTEPQIPEENDTASVENVAHVAMLLFAGYIEAATSMSESCGGGGSSPESAWGRKDDEDDLKFARRCIRMAHSMCKPRPRGIRR